MSFIAVYVDDLLIAGKDPLAITKCLEATHLFKLKGTGPLKYHLGCDYFTDDTSTLCFGPVVATLRMTMIWSAQVY
jgi:hypothetical protein